MNNRVLDSNYETLKKEFSSYSEDVRKRGQLVNGYSGKIKEIYRETKNFLESMMKESATSPQMTAHYTEAMKKIEGSMTEWTTTQEGSLKSITEFVKQIEEIKAKVERLDQVERDLQRDMTNSQIQADYIQKKSEIFEVVKSVYQNRTTAFDHPMVSLQFSFNSLFYCLSVVHYDSADQLQTSLPSLSNPVANLFPNNACFDAQKPSQPPQAQLKKRPVSTYNGVENSTPENQTQQSISKQPSSSSLSSNPLFNKLQQQNQPEQAPQTVGQPPSKPQPGALKKKPAPLNTSATQQPVLKPSGGPSTPQPQPALLKKRPVSVYGTSSNQPQQPQQQPTDDTPPPPPPRPGRPNPETSAPAKQPPMGGIALPSLAKPQPQQQPQQQQQPTDDTPPPPPARPNRSMSVSSPPTSQNTYTPTPSKPDALIPPYQPVYPPYNPTPTHQPYSPTPTYQPQQQQPQQVYKPPAQYQPPQRYQPPTQYQPQQPQQQAVQYQPPYQNSSAYPSQQQRPYQAPPPSTQKAKKSSLSLRSLSQMFVQPVVVPITEAQPSIDELMFDHATHRKMWHKRFKVTREYKISLRYTRETRYEIEVGPFSIISIYGSQPVSLQCQDVKAWTFEISCEQTGRLIDQAEYIPTNGLVPVYRLDYTDTTAKGAFILRHITEVDMYNNELKEVGPNEHVDYVTLTELEQYELTRPTTEVNFDDPAFAQFIHQNRLQPIQFPDGTTESVICFCYRVSLFIKKHISYELNSGNQKPLETMAKKLANCGSYANLFTGITRFNGIPTRINFGMAVYPDRVKDGLVDAAAHAQTEFYYEGLWIPYCGSVITNDVYNKHAFGMTQLLTYVQEMSHPRLDAKQDLRSLVGNYYTFQSKRNGNKLGDRTDSELMEKIN